MITTGIIVLPGGNQTFFPGTLAETARYAFNDGMS